MSSDFTHILSPLDVGPFTLRNRILVTAHVPGLESGGVVNDAYIAYQRARARATAGSGPHRSPGAFGRPAEQIVPSIR